ncbi:hydroxylase [Nocardia farcinica]
MSTVHEVAQRIDQLADRIAEQSVPNDELGHLTDESTKLLKSVGVVRMLQPRDRGGYEAHPAEFLETVMNTAALSPSAGWVAGVVGVHPWELGLADPRLQEELWGQDPDTWIASPYAPMGRARIVDGGFVLSGRWSFSSGTDQCDWVVIGGLVVDADDKVTGIRHFVLPRGDYEIVEGSWEVVGLAGTGSKDLLITEAYVPAYRTIDNAALIDGSLAESSRPGNALYALPFGVLFSYAIASATIGITEGALAFFVDYTRGRVGLDGSRASQYPHQLSALGAASADINASRSHILTNISRMYDIAASGRKLSENERIAFRNDQVRASRRAVDAVDTLFTHAGGGSLRLDQPFQRYWRDSHAAMNHLCNVADPIYQGYGAARFGGSVGALFF